MTHATKAIYGLTMMDTVRIQQVMPSFHHPESTDESTGIRTQIAVVDYTMKRTSKHHGNRQSLSTIIKTLSFPEVYVLPHTTLGTSWEHLCS